MNASPPAVPPGFEPLALGGEFMRHNGPLYLRALAEAGLAGRGAPTADAAGAAGGADAGASGPRRVQIGFRVESRHTNPAGICHGGMMASFCDMLLPVCAHHQVPAVARRFLPTINLQIDYLAPSPLGAWVQGEADVLRCTTTLAFIQGLVTADGEPVARASGIFKIGPLFPHPRGG